MSRFLFLSLLIYGLLFTGLAAMNGAVIALAIPLLLYLGAGLLYRPERLRLRAERRLSRHYLSPDQPVEVELSLTNEGPPLEEVHLQDLLPARLTPVEGRPARRVAGLAAGQTITLRYTVRGGRGLHRFEGVRVTAWDHLRLFRRQTTIPAPGQCLILPAVARLQRVEIRPRQTRIYSGQIPARQGGPGVEFFGVREYQPGDPPRRINARATARHPRRLYINEFEQERVADIGLILDARQQSNAWRDDESLFEYSVQATASLADAFLQAGNRVGLFIYGRSLDWTIPGYGKMQRERILQALARAEPGGGAVFERLHHLPTRLFPAHSQLALVSPLLPADPDLLILLRARGYRLLVISPDPVRFERQSLPQTPEAALAARCAQLERALILRKLAQTGIRVLDWAVDTPFQEAAHLTLRRFRAMI